MILRDKEPVITEPQSLYGEVFPSGMGRDRKYQANWLLGLRPPPGRSTEEEEEPANGKSVER